MGEFRDYRVYSVSFLVLVYYYVFVILVGIYGELKNDLRCFLLRN